MSMQAAEYTAIREELYFLRPLKAKLAGVLFWLAVLLWFQVRQFAAACQKGPASLLLCGCIVATSC
jgi:hypothetical protein